MLSIKFRKNKKVSIRTKVEIIKKILDIIDIDRKIEMYYSDYTFNVFV